MHSTSQKSGDTAVRGLTTDEINTVAGGYYAP